jgi:histidyl-tRNA synthetase
MALSTQPYKGARDFYPEDKRFQKYIFGIMRQVVEKYGYEEYDAPILEPTELYASKTSDEIVNEQTYTFTDRGDRSVTIRTEMTPSVSRMVAAQRQELAYPLRWYSIPNLWRYERPQRGRLREFWQLNVDLFGISTIEADHEMIMIADSIMKAFGANHEMYTIRINSRKLINSLLHEYLGLDETQGQSLIRLIDRMHKMDHAEFVAQADAVFTPSQRDNGTSDRLLEILQSESLDTLPEMLHGHDSVKDLRNLLTLLEKSHIVNAIFDPSLMRGFDYYTDIVFEVFDNNPDNNRSMFGGGRYDGLVGLFGVEPVPTVGFGMGDVTLQNFLEAHNLLPKLKNETDLYVILIGEVYERSLQIVAELREMGLNVQVDSTGRKADKQLKTAIKKGINYVLFIGENELKEEQFKLKNLHTGNEETHGIHRIVSVVKDYRTQ